MNLADQKWVPETPPIATEATYALVVNTLLTTISDSGTHSTLR